MNKEILLLGYGNPGRGDDALGPLLLERLDQAGLENCEFLACFQLQPELILELEKHRLILFADASISAPAPFSFTELTARCDISHSSHAMNPEILLHVYETVLQHPHPSSFLMSIRGGQFALGEEPGVMAVKHLDAAAVFVTELLNRPEFLHWRDRLTLSQFQNTKNTRGC